MVRENRRAAAIVSTMRPMLVAVEMCRRPTDVHPDMRWLSVCTESFGQNRVAANGWSPHRLRVPPLWSSANRSRPNSRLISIRPDRTGRDPEICNGRQVERFLCLRIPSAERVRKYFLWFEYCAKSGFRSETYILQNSTASSFDFHNTRQITNVRFELQKSIPHLHR